jgi:hypothetical protein
MTRTTSSRARPASATAIKMEMLGLKSKCIIPGVRHQYVVSCLSFGHCTNLRAIRKRKFALRQTACEIGLPEPNANNICRDGSEEPGVMLHESHWQETSIVVKGGPERRSDVKMERARGIR